MTTQNDKSIWQKIFCHTISNDGKVTAEVEDINGNRINVDLDLLRYERRNAGYIFQTALDSFKPSVDYLGTKKTLVILAASL